LKMMEISGVRVDFEYSMRGCIIVGPLCLCPVKENTNRDFNDYASSGRDIRKDTKDTES